MGSPPSSLGFFWGGGHIFGVSPHFWGTREFDVDEPPLVGGSLLARALLVTQSVPNRGVFPTARWPSPRERHRISSQRTAGRPTLQARLPPMVCLELDGHPFICWLFWHIGWWTKSLKMNWLSDSRYYNLGMLSVSFPSQNQGEVSVKGLGLGFPWA